MFQFKQFTIHQQNTAIKVCTDSCLFGAWVAQKLIEQKINPHTILDIGAGTGLLSLMLAQKLNSHITALEIEDGAALQATENFKASSWNERLELIHVDAIQYKPGKQFDFIITNPPFFSNDLKSPSAQKNIAKHDHGIKLDELVKVIGNLLKPEGIFAILLPFLRKEEFIGISRQEGYFVKNSLDVKQTPGHSFFRSMMIFSKDETDFTKEEITIKNESGNYSDEFIELLKDYYLYL